MASETKSSQMTYEEIMTADGYRLRGRFFTPSGAGRGSGLIVPAMGAPQDYYAPFATWLAAQGFLVATFDYRGTGRSRPPRLRGFKADLFDWARLDCSAMVAALAQRAPHQPLYWIGHSLGGQIVPFVLNRERITKVITIATGSGYWREIAPPLRWRVWWLWYVAAPLAVAVFGYFPGKRLRKVGDLPKGVLAQWRRWCLHPEYAVGAEGEAARAQYAAIRAPMVFIAFSDDDLMPTRNIDALLEFYANAPRTLKRIVPHAIGVRRIGHFGFFRPAFEHSLWRAHVLPELG